MKNHEASVTIGMPVYNGDKYLDQAIESILSQTFHDFTLVISDNHSSDGTESICKKWLAKDSRVQYFRQPETKPARFNFEFVLQKSQSPYFMWAACDDVWAPSFLETTHRRLVDEKRSLAFTQFVNTDHFNQKIRDYPHLKDLAGPLSSSSIWTYIRQNDYLGKANPIYSLMKTDVIRQTYDRWRDQFHLYGGDMIVVYAMILEGGLAFEPTTLFFKRISSPDDVLGSPKNLNALPFHPRFVDYREYLGYQMRYLRVSRSRGHYLVPMAAVTVNLVQMTLAKILAKIFRA